MEGGRDTRREGEWREEGRETGGREEGLLRRGKRKRRYEVWEGTVKGKRERKCKSRDELDAVNEGIIRRGRIFKER